MKFLSSWFSNFIINLKKPKILTWQQEKVNLQNILIISAITLILGISLLIDPLAYLSFHSPKNYFLIIAVPLLALFYIFSVFKEKDHSYGLNLLIILLFLRSVWLAITNTSVLTTESNLGFLINVNLVLLTFITHQLVLKNGKALKNKILFIIFIVGAVQSFIGIGQFFIYYDINPAAMKTVMLGTIGAANGYGLILTLAIISGIFVLINAPGKITRAFVVSALIVQLTALILNRSRGAALILFIILSILLYHHRLSLFKIRILSFLQKPLIYIPVFSGILITAVIMLFSLNVESSMGRILAWRISAPMFIENPVLGVGYNNLAVEYLNYQAEFFQNESNLSLAYKAANLKQAHNEYLQSFCETGIIGGLLFLLIILIPVYQLYKNRHKANSNFFILLILLGIALHSLIDTPLHVLPILVITYTLIGFTPFSKFKWQINNKLISFVLVILFFAFFVLIGYKVIRQYPAYHSWQKGYACLNKRNLNCAISSYEQAINSLPDKGELLFHLGSAKVLNKEYVSGIDLLKKSLKNFNDRNIYLSLSYGYLRLNKLSDAEYWSEIALSMFPDQLAPHLLLGEIYFYKGDFPESKASLKKCINQETTIKSKDTELIVRDARALWKKFYY